VCYKHSKNFLIIGLESVGGETATNVATGVVVEEVLEEAPKWKVLREILEETQEERLKQAFSEEDNSDNNGIVLVACKDERSCMQLEDCITNNPQKVQSDNSVLLDLTSFINNRYVPCH
jgi:DNA excision repair protein ERCC-4